MLLSLVIILSLGWYLHVQSLKADVQRLKGQNKAIREDSRKAVKDLQIAIKLYKSKKEELEN